MLPTLMETTTNMIGAAKRYAMLSMMAWIEIYSFAFLPRDHPWKRTKSQKIRTRRRKRRAAFEHPFSARRSPRPRRRTSHRQWQLPIEHTMNRQGKKKLTWNYPFCATRQGILHSSTLWFPSGSTLHEQQKTIISFPPLFLKLQSFITTSDV